jgi:cell division protease FtsH
MVTKWGLSEKMGPLLYDEGGEEVFLGRSASQPHKAISDETAKQIDAEVRRIIDECYEKARDILEENVDKLHLMAEALMQYETIDSDQIDDIMEGRAPREPSDWNGRGSSDDGGSGPQWSDRRACRRTLALDCCPGRRGAGLRRPAP